MSDLIDREALLDDIYRHLPTSEMCGDVIRNERCLFYHLINSSFSLRFSIFIACSRFKAAEQLSHSSL